MIDTRELNFVSAVIYAGSSSGDIMPLIETVYDVLEANFMNYEIICVNDSAPPELLKAVRDFRAMKNIKAVSFVNMSEGWHGREESMVAGADAAIGDYIFEFDSSCLDWEGSVMMEAYHRAAEGFDIVAVKAPGSRVSLASRIFYGIYNKYSGTPYPLGTERFRVLSRRAVNRAESFSKIIPYRKAVYAFSGVKITGIEYEPSAGRVIRSGRKGERWDTASDALILFTNVAYKISMMFSLMMALIMFASGLYVVAVYFSSHKPVEGWAPLTGIICLGFMSVFVLQALTFKHLEMILRLEFRKQQYIVSSVERL